MVHAEEMVYVFAKMAGAAPLVKITALAFLPVVAPARPLQRGEHRPKPNCEELGASCSAEACREHTFWQEVCLPKRI